MSSPVKEVDRLRLIVFPTTAGPRSVRVFVGQVAVYPELPGRNGLKICPIMALKNIPVVLLPERRRLAGRSIYR